MLTKPSGIKSIEFNDNAVIANQNRNDALLDFLLRPYREQVDLTTLDAAAKIYTTVWYKRPEDGTIAITSVLSAKDVNGNYLTDTWTIVLPAGTVTRTWTLTYDAEGALTDKTYVDS
jgi:hypothetical protein